MKKILAIVMVTAMIAALAVTTSAADVPTDGLISHITFENGMINEVTGETLVLHEAGRGNFGDGLYAGDEDELELYQNGVNGGSSYWMSNGDGFEVGTIDNGSDFTIGIWITINWSDTGINPYIWWGATNQSPENWIGIWNVNIADGWTRNCGPTIGSNTSPENRLEVVPATTEWNTSAENGIILPWTYAVITGVYDADSNSYTGTLYINGVNEGSVAGLPNPNDKDGAIVYANSVNAWADPAGCGYMDDIVLYNRALSDDEVAALYALYEVPTFADASEMDSVPTNLSSAAPDDPAPADTKAPETEAPAGTEAPAQTEAPADGNDAAPAETEAPAESGGCGSTLGAAAAIVALTGVFGCAIVKKH